MPASAAILAVAVAFVATAWVLAVARAARAAHPEAPARRSRAVGSAIALVLALVVADGALALSGVLARFDRLPPPFLPFVLGGLGFGVAIAFGPLGRLLATHTSLAALVGFQSFRILAEALIFNGVHEGIAPVQLSFEGLNFDIVTGVTAIPVALYLRRHPRATGVARAWTFMGLGFLVIIFVVATLSMPGPFRRFMSEPSNAWVMTFPYVLLPGVLVVAAFAGHLIVLRKLALARRAP